MPAQAAGRVGPKVRLQALLREGSVRGFIWLASGRLRGQGAGRLDRFADLQHAAAADERMIAHEPDGRVAVGGLDH
jgi:hypothetical protein